MQDNAVEHSFEPGTFRPSPQRAHPCAMLRAQGLIEAKLFLRHGEQLLLSFIVPVGMLLTVGLVPLIKHAVSLTVGFPVMLAIAAMSSGFTGQAIALAFDRRYGALKRTGASGVPAWTIIGGKIIGLVVVSVLQAVILSVVAMMLGWHVPVVAALVGFGVFFFGVACFTALGMLMGGTLSSELVLGLANLVWLLLVGVAGYCAVSGVDVSGWLLAIPSIALAEGIKAAFAGLVPVAALVSLLLWTVVGVLGAAKWFKFAD
ncbi:MAG: multidrug ABC transporter permease [Corynebacterium sp.]|uniref:ABC transporter permease n=1 Tax=Corynebacterium sp. TaxID=1720 RepID=UPI0026DAF86F|nr:ABC transporter permease [Corynebacterium sp.]MDO4760387.1 multidrug ABC transporter permease [Corynebacterium sp.]